MSVSSAREDEVMRDVSKRETLLRLYRYLFAYKKHWRRWRFLLLITLAVTLATPLMIELAIDTYVANRDTAGLLRLAVIALLLSCCICSAQDAGCA